MSYNYNGGVSNNPGERCKNIAPWVWWDNVFTNEELDKICEISSKNLEKSKVFAPDEKNPHIQVGVEHTKIRVS